MQTTRNAQCKGNGWNPKNASFFLLLPLLLLLPPPLLGQRLTLIRQFELDGQSRSFLLLCNLAAS